MAETTNKRKRAAAAPKALAAAKEEAKPKVVAELHKGENETVSLDDLEGEVVAEFTQQLSITGQFIYNAQEEDTTLIVENLGFGDIYVSDKPNLQVGNEEQRLLFKEQKGFKARKLFMTSSSQPVASIIEIK
ncbi:hypothetical protein [Paenibacillus silvae]|uniref:hypothetical protein n=1 Tax=Paenibacillus silvae TaxID=1325358 RepID=UPI0011A0BD59|nr:MULTISPECIES: hypothetical protein [Paenibacillus]MCK6076918.1 hypothetical protein [Paenibacillus silvae]MCK6152360.1 hypothetical protein [Paenibacillus silvae]MCK6269575.1 hypothetical protein [Paenibacillus silvae]